MKPFDSPVYVTRPLLPDLNEFSGLIQEIWASQWLTNNGQLHQRLEEETRRLLKVPNLCLFNNGTVALMVAVNSLGLSGEVITTPFTFPATPHVLAWSGIRPVFCDIDEKTMNIAPGLIEALITPETTAILAVHVFGTPCDTQTIQNIAGRHGLKVIYDAAHAFNVEVNGQGIGNFGDMSMFSFHATKLFHTAEGGALTFRDSKLKQRVDLLKNFGIKNEEEVITPGINGKMNEIQAALGLANLRCLDAEREKRREIEKVYFRCLGDVAGITLNRLPPGCKSSYQYFVIRIDEEKFGLSRDELHRRLKDFNVYCRKYFYPLCSDYPCYQHLPSASPASLPVAGKVVRQVLCLPFYGSLGTSAAEKICELIRGFGKK